uniref:RAS guanyl-releasing protein 4 isoform X6 n=1 Tax=Jaculus jaculus TaxID=51337 RepID=UPI000332FDCD|nr:RAS guanyl-releasing protein 4 isoform X6 [Jaculus jaculus]
MNRKDSNRKCHQECSGKAGGRGQPRLARRHKTCPSPREISKVMASMNLGLLSEGSCSEDELLEKCFQCFDSAGSLRCGDHILNMVLAMHSWVLPSADLAARLLSSYQKATKNEQEMRQLQICYFVRYWMTQHPEAVHQEPQLEEVINRFWTTVAQEGNSAQRSLRDVFNLLSPEGPGPPPPLSSPGLGKKRKVSLLFDHLETEELAQHLTYLEFRSFQAIMALLELTELLASHNNYARYRRAWANCTGFRLPVLGIHLKDLVSLHEAQPNRLPDGRLHLPKLNNLYLRVRELVELQGQHPPCSANEDLLHLLMLSLDLFYTEDEIYELSYAREPRCPKSLPPSPYKASLVMEWASGVTPKPDRVTLRRHVEQLVVSVFKNYDPEGTGTISQEDFERLSGNFPFACHGLHPPCHQGGRTFSREELTEYLLRASAICSKLGLAFLHTFHEVTFRKPTFCDNCSGFLWGVTKQGYRCQDCGLCCHRHCRDQVRVECKKKPGAKGDIGPPGASVPPPSPLPSASYGSEDNLSYILPMDPETGCHLCHAWTQTEYAHTSWKPEMVPFSVPVPSSTSSSKLDT